MSLPEYMKNITRLRNANSQQLDWLLKWKCSHRHNGVRHFNCFTKEFGLIERIGFLDIETSNLKADFGIVLAWCLLNDNGDIIWGTIDKELDIDTGTEDKRLIASCIGAMKFYDRIITHYGTYFDIPFLRSRALIHGLAFPEYGTLWHTDTWKMAKRTLCFHSNRQNCIAEGLYGKTQKTRISHPAWRKAMLGDDRAALEVLDHCKKDVSELRKNYRTLLPYYKLSKSSI